MLAWFSGCLVRAVETANGILTWSRIEPALRRFGPHNAPTTLISLENTHNMGGGTVYPQQVIDEICAEAHERGLKVHMDGARIFNAATALGVDVKTLTRGFDTVMFCLSKGLSAPVGSMLVGSAELIDQARIYRKALGGGMRQAGVLAAAGLIALEKMPARLHEDHANARLLAESLSHLEGVSIDLDAVETNIVIFRMTGALSAADLVGRLKTRGILASTVGPDAIRLVTHNDVNRAQCVKAAEALTDEIEAATTVRA
jgi:threonine aldolase